MFFQTWSLNKKLVKNEKSLIKKRFLFFANKSVGGISMKREAIPSNNNFILALNRMPTKLLGRETMCICTTWTKIDGTVFNRTLNEAIYSWYVCITWRLIFPPFNQIGFGFLTFESEDAVDQVCAEHFININGKQVLSIHFINFNSLFFSTWKFFQLL